MQQPSWSMKQLKRRGLALLPCRCPQSLHGALTSGPHDHQRGHSTGWDTPGSRACDSLSLPGRQRVPARPAPAQVPDGGGGRWGPHSGRSSPSPSLGGRQAPSPADSVVLTRPVPSWELSTPSLPSSCWSEDDIRFGKCPPCGGHRAGASQHQQGLHPGLSGGDWQEPKSLGLGGPEAIYLFNEHFYSLLWARSCSNGFTLL